MDLYHTESKLDMRTLLVMNPQDLAEQGIGVEKFFENVKEVANSMRDRQRQATVSDALCAKSVFDQQEDGSVFSYVEIFPFPKMSTSKRFFYTTANTRVAAFRRCNMGWGTLCSAPNLSLVGRYSRGDRLNKKCN
jgi:hypothetical protein